MGGGGGVSNSNRSAPTVARLKCIRTLDKALRRRLGPVFCRQWGDHSSALRGGAQSAANLCGRRSAPGQLRRRGVAPLRQCRRRSARVEGGDTGIDLRPQGGGGSAPGHDLYVAAKAQAALLEGGIASQKPELGEEVLVLGGDARALAHLVPQPSQSRGALTWKLEFVAGGQADHNTAWRGRWRRLWSRPHHHKRPRPHAARCQRQAVEILWKLPSS
mmetsp:Transcript_95896/g.310895  ORF Transcript_95896/g.310895 Transcript_95896/m.310895 type:complete len:217 (-) Transcript_95896:1592-2242(-)